MEEQLPKRQSTPQIGADVKNDLVDKVLNRLQQIDKSQGLLLIGEEVLGIFKTSGLIIDHIVITHYRIFGVNFTKSHGNVVFANELAEKNIQSITVQATKGLFNQVSYIIEIEKDGKKSKYATVKSADADSIVKLLEKIKSSETLTSLIQAQKQLADEEDTERKAERAKSTAAKLAKSEELKQTRAEQSQALKKAEIVAKKQVELEKEKQKVKEKEAKQVAKQEQKSAKIAAAMARGRELGYVQVNYVGGYNSDLRKSSFSDFLSCYENEVIFKKRDIIIPANQIVSFEITGKEQTNSRLSVTRMATLGVFSLAAPKRSTKKEANVYISLKDGRRVMFNTESLSESEVHKKLANAISHYSSLRNRHETQQQAPATVDVAGEIVRFAELKNQGLLTDDEFEAKKKQLLNL